MFFNFNYFNSHKLINIIIKHGNTKRPNRLELILDLVRLKKFIDSPI